MKLFYTKILFLFSSWLLFGQIDSLKEVLKYYPLEIGNYWEYDSFLGDVPEKVSVKPGYWLKVEGDTLMPNGITYKKIKYCTYSPSYIYWRYERIDTSTSSVYRLYDGKEYKIDSLFAKPGNEIFCARFGITNSFRSPWLTVCLSEQEENLFNEKLLVKTFRDQTSSMNYKYKLAKGIGYVYTESWELIYQGHKLRYARVNGIEYGTPVGIAQSTEIPTNYILYQNYPNPFNPITNINYEIPVASKVSLKIYNLLGAEIGTIVNKYQTAGKYNYIFDGKLLSTGVYFYRIEAGKYSSTRKMLLLK